MKVGSASFLSPAGLSRRHFVQLAGSAPTGLMFTRPLDVFTGERPALDLPELEDDFAAGVEPLPARGDPPAERIGFAVVGLGQVMLEHVLPAFAACRHARPLAIVSGHPDKARKIAARHGIPPTQVYSYETIDRLRDQPAIQAVYLALPNFLHAEFTVRAARAGKHVLCEKPMATSSAEGQRMVDACAHAGVKLMIGYRAPYEPMGHALLQAVRDQRLGTLRELIAGHSLRQEDPRQWRLRRRLAGGGPILDVGIDAINAARLLSGEEPSRVFAQTVQWSDDPRFTEVETSAQCVLQFPSGFTATCSCSFDSHPSHFLRLTGSEGWAELNPADASSDLLLELSESAQASAAAVDARRDPRNAFARELDHFAQCVASGMQPHTPGEDGLQDLRIVEALYASARTGRVIEVEAPAAEVRGPDLRVES